jgi:glycosyltransferase involved in cell wall biosynthesis
MLNIIIPVYNGSKLLRQALNSLVAQTKQQFIVTVVDDCSTEDIRAVLKEYEWDIPYLSYLRTNTNRGPAIARQMALDRMDKKIDYVMFLDADDMLMPYAVEMLTKEIAITGADFVVSDFVNDKYNKAYETYGLDKNKTWLHGKIYRVSFLREFNICFPEVRYNEDTGFNLKVYDLARKQAYLNVPTYIYRSNAASLTAQSDMFLVDHCYDFLFSVFQSLIHVYAYRDDEKLDSFAALCLRQAHVFLEMVYQYKPDLFNKCMNYCRQVFTSSILYTKLRQPAFHKYLAFYSMHPVDTGNLVVFPKLSFRMFLTQFVDLSDLKEYIKDLKVEDIIK